MSAKSMCDISYSQGHEFILALEKAGFNGDIVQQVINSRGNKMAKAMFATVQGEVQTDNRFELLKSFDVTAPEGYDHATRLDTFRAAHQSEENKEFYFYNDAITDSNYAAKATTKLVPCRQFTVKVFGITERVTSDDCLAKLRREKAILVGAQGCTLVYEQSRNELPKGKWSVSFDEKKALWRDGNGYCRVPYLDMYSDGNLGFYLGNFESGWNSDCVLLCFCDKESSDA